MSLIHLQHLNQEIKDKLFELSYKIEGFGKTGDFDISRYAEIYFKNLLNIIYKNEGWNFKKAIKITQDTYDLYDENNKICIQITSNSRQDKKNHTVNSFVKNRHYESFKKLIIIFISYKKPQKITKTALDFTYVDFNIIEFVSLIESKCGKSELLEIRDILCTKDEIPTTKDISKNRNSAKLSKQEFMRCIKLEKELKKELLKPIKWDREPLENTVKYPYLNFKDSRFILRAIDDESYPEVNSKTKWCRTFMYDFYDKGILIWLNAIIGSTGILNEKGEWYIKKYEQENDPVPNNCREIDIIILGKLPYTNIVHYKDGDDYYNDYHLYCEYVGIKNTPYDEIIYKYANGMGYYWEELDNSKRLEY